MLAVAPSILGGLARCSNTGTAGHPDSLQCPYVTSRVVLRTVVQCPSPQLQLNLKSVVSLQTASHALAMALPVVQLELTTKSTTVP